jgi:hypothetical protein
MPVKSTSDEILCLTAEGLEEVELDTERHNNN